MNFQERAALSRSLKGCPFCGGRAELKPMPGVKAGSWWRVQCDQWRCGGTNWAMGSAQKSVDAWNQRVDSNGQA
jgi:hypothetical protein